MMGCLRSELFTFIRPLVTLIRWFYITIRRVTLSQNATDSQCPRRRSLNRVFFSSQAFLPFNIFGLCLCSILYSNSLSNNSFYFWSIFPSKSFTVSSSCFCLAFSITVEERKAVINNWNFNPRSSAHNEGVTTSAIEK